MAPSPPDADDDNFADFVEKTPLVFRVEVATLSLSADEWAAIEKGMVIDTGMKVGDPLVLRVGGKIAGEATLVVVVGERGEKRVGIRLNKKIDQEV